MTILNEYLSYLNEEDKEKKSKWKDRLKKYGKIAAGAAVAGAVAYAGKKAYDKNQYNKSFKGKVVNKTKDVVKDFSDKRKENKKIKAKRKQDKKDAKIRRAKRNENVTKNRYKNWKRDRERAQDQITRDRWLDKLQDKVKGDESKKPSFFKRRRNKRKEKGIIKKLKYKVGIDD